MLTAERRQFILEKLQKEGRVIASEVSIALKVSEDTIRRDLRDMAEAGMLQRVHGGALPRSPASGDYGSRQTLAPNAKVEIGRTAAGLIRDGQIVILDGGTTALQVAQHLSPDLKATIITNSPPVAMALAKHETIELVLLGGHLYKYSLVTVGAATIEALHMIRADIYMLGVCSLHPEVGISTTSLEEAYIKRAMIASAAEVMALASAEKLGTAISYVVGPITDLTHIITESGVSEEALLPYRNHGITIVKP